MVLLDPGFAGSGAIGPQVVVDRQVWNEAVFLQQLPHEFQRRMFAAFSLDQHIEDFAFGIDGAPLMDRMAIDLQIDLIQMPDRGGPGPALAQVRGDHRSEMVHPAPDCLAGDRNATFGPQVFDVTQAQGELERARSPGE